MDKNDLKQSAREGKERSMLTREWLKLTIMKCPDFVRCTSMLKAHFGAANVADIAFEFENISKVAIGYYQSTSKVCEAEYDPKNH